MKTQIILIIIIVVLFALQDIFVYQLGKNSAKAQIIRDTDTLITYVDVRDTLIIPKFITKTKIDTIVNNLTDTIFIDKTQYIAQLDTTYEDDLAKIKVEFVSDIPLSKKSYFSLALDIKKEIVFVPTYVKDESFFHNRFIPYIGVGLSYGIDSKIIEPAIQLGLGIRIN